MASIFSLLVAGSYCWFVASSLWVYPHSLSYFNESIGGPLNGAEHLLGSNVDWGQDLRYVKWWIKEHPEARPAYLAYFGFFDPSDVDLSGMGGLEDYWQHRKYQREGSVMIAVSLNIYNGAKWHVRDGANGTVRILTATEPRRMSGLQEQEMCGYSMWILN